MFVVFQRNNMHMLISFAHICWHLWVVITGVQVKAHTLYHGVRWFTFVSAQTQFYDHVYCVLPGCFVPVLLSSWCLFISVAWCICCAKAELSGVELFVSLLSHIYSSYPLRSMICFGFN